MRLFLILGSLNAALAIAAGAFAAHGLKSSLSTANLSVFQTSAQYHFYHGLALLLTGILIKQFPDKKSLMWSGHLFILGILFFSGSLYILSLSGIRWVGAITPIGGVAFISAWLIMALAFIKKDVSRPQ